MSGKKSGLDNSKTVIIIIQDVKQEYKMELSKRYSGKIIFSFQNGIFQGGRREHNFAPREIDRSLK